MTSSTESSSLPPASATSLQAAATINAAERRPSVPRLPDSRRRSAVMMNLMYNDPSIPAPGEMSHGEPVLASRSRRQSRAMSIGELHQELEAEQELQVNRLLAMIRQQQAELQKHQSPIADDSAVVMSPHVTSPQLSSTHPPFSRSPSITIPRASLDAQRPSVPSSRGTSPRLRPTSMSGESDPFIGRDENAFYQAETQMLTRENQMLRHRIRELEKQLGDSHIANEPVKHSHLNTTESAKETSAKSST